MDDDLITIAKDARRIGKDARSAIGILDHKFTRYFESTGAPRRDGSLIARIAACRLIEKSERNTAAAVAQQYWPHDMQLRAAVGPARTDTAGWSAELLATAVEDVSSTLLGPSVFGQLRELSAVSYDLVDGAAVKSPSHSSVPSGGFFGEGAPITVGALLIGAVNLQTKKAASITAVTREVLKGSAANVQTSLERLLAEDLSLAVDVILLDAVAADAIRPAGLRNGVAGLVPAAAGTPTEKAAADVGALIGAIMPASKPVLIAAGRQTASLGAYMPAMPVVAAPLLPAGMLIAVDADAFANIVGPVDIAASGDPVLHMESAAPLPLVTGAQGAGVPASPMSSMFQIAATSLRCILDIDWSMRRANAVAWMTGAGW
ncbi:phage major capsid protein [Bradyrhizobium sp. AUGA SZCCT0042]|uniref:phage major capsid family protein n=1 Tax=Bradyrhizobium sp. AUGA SZCCT0042 TaxID=2807651 RepID=UPI001BA62834|nr:phage major capsid protein [Bradyrhizobium sp. AUGA SZCCT0042]MBR1296649.1 phage major capsid protein [Bradyrhizobium sp. AUGA SZCCT0042]